MASLSILGSEADYSYGKNKSRFYYVQCNGGSMGYNTETGDYINWLTVGK